MAVTIALLLAAPELGLAQAGDPSFECLGERSVTQVVGDYDSRFTVRYPPRRGVDARAARFYIPETTTRSGVWLLGSTPGVCWTGGFITSDFPLSASWSDLKKKNHAGIGFQHRDFELSGLYIFNVHDGIRPRIRDHFEIRHVWLDYIRDDCIENDYQSSGLVYDSLFDGCNTFLSTRPGKSMTNTDGRTSRIDLDRVLVRLEPQPHPNKESSRNAASSVRVDGTVYGHGNMFKTHGAGPRVTIKNSIFLAQIRGMNRRNSLSFPNVGECSNNVIVWLGSGPYPGQYPRHCFQITTDVEVWRQAVRAWHERHPEVGWDHKPPVDMMGSTQIGRS